MSVPVPALPNKRIDSVERQQNSRNTSGNCHVPLPINPKDLTELPTKAPDPKNFIAENLDSQTWSRRRAAHGMSKRNPREN
jgi:hypothetical protein